MAKDFSGRDLRGISFKGQDLRGVDFSDTRLGGVDFTGADLTGAKFCRARMGRTTMTKALLFCLLILVHVILLATFIALELVFSIITIPLFYLYFSWRTMRKEELQPAMLRNLALWFECVGGTQFAGANLTEVDFSAANLDHARFAASSQLTRCIWKDTRNLRFAQTRHTFLETRKMRELLTNGITNESDFANLNLAGATLTGLNLRGFDFSNSNLSDADFSGSDLTGANLAAISAVGAHFSHAILSGACIQNWNIDTRTEFDGIVCTHVYLAPNQGERNPPKDDFQAGEFSKLYQQVAGTIDFIVHSRAELTAITAAIATIKANGCADLYVQNIERKEDAIVLKVKAPPEFDRNEIYEQVKKETALQIQLAVAENTIKYLSKNQDFLEDLLKDAQKRPVNIQVENHMNNRNTNLNGNTISNSVVNLGDHATVSNKVRQETGNQEQLKTLLAELHTLISNSNASPTVRNEAAQHANTIAEVALQEGAPELGRVRRALSFIKDVFAEGENITEVGEKIGNLLGRIGGFFGL